MPSKSGMTPAVREDLARSRDLARNLATMQRDLKDQFHTVGEHDLAKQLEEMAAGNDRFVAACNAKLGESE